MNNILYFLIMAISLCCMPRQHKQHQVYNPIPPLEGHWKLYDAELVDSVPFLNKKAPEPEIVNMVAEDSPWDSYKAYDLVFEKDSFYQVNYPIQAYATQPYFIDTGYIHIGPKNKLHAYPVEFVNDTLIFYRPVRAEARYFKEKYIRTNFNDSTLNIMKTFGINYPELAGTWMLIREEDYDYGTHYELKFPHKIPDSIVFTKDQMITALKGEKIFMMKTDGIKRDYTFFYKKPHIELKPGKWYKGEDPWIHFYMK